MMVVIFAWLGLLGFYFYSRRNSEKVLSELIDDSGSFEGVEGVKSVIDVRRFNDDWLTRAKFATKEIERLLDPNPLAKLALFFIISALIIWFVNDSFFKQNIWYVLLVLQPTLLVFFLVKLKSLRAKQFQSNFPDALNILSGALSAGQSIVHAFEYVGVRLDNDVGAEFKLMSERLLIGEDADDVLMRSASSFPYVEYFFFIAAIRINLSRGGQLKEVINRINRIMFNVRAIEKKKNALTSEARSSAKIISALPFIFLAILKFTSPENYNFVMFEDGGKVIFYYVVVSELIGFFCIWMILRGVD